MINRNEGDLRIADNEFTDLLVFELNETQNSFFDNKKWKFSRDIALLLAQKICELVESRNLSFILILDDNFLLKSMRKKYYQLCNK